MNILIACEFSGVVRRAFAARGHTVTSCDLLPADDASPDRWKKRSTTYTGIAEAMATQWSPQS